MTHGKAEGCVVLVMGPDGAMSEPAGALPEGEHLSMTVRGKCCHITLPNGSLLAFVKGQVESWFSVQSILKDIENMPPPEHPCVIFRHDEDKTTQD